MPPATRGSVRQIREHEVPAWCACPLDTEAWIEGERAWVARWHEDCRNLFAFAAGDEFLGKYDVPMEEKDRWTLWAPSVRDGPTAGAVMEALCAHALAESRRRGIARLDVTLEESQRHFEMARRYLLDAGFQLEDERIVVVRDLTAPLPELPDCGLEYRSAADLPSGDLAGLCRAVGMSGKPPTDRDAVALGRVAWRGTIPIGLALPSSFAGDRELILRHFGIVSEARGQGYGLALLLEVLHRARAAGASTYVGSASQDNRPMLRLFERAGCVRPRKRLVFGHGPLDR
ncbi:MAG: GNAT family N-acetyltransferase [Planctomycetota bacterium]|jgi:GNAT superfamily N-acetyltransferase